MSSIDLRELYQEVILDHSKRPRNFGVPAEYSCCAEGFNPLCGDQVSIYLTVDHSTVISAHFDGAGCAISTASASMLTEEVTGKTVEEAQDLFRRFREMATGVGEADVEEMGQLAALAGVREFPVRIKCATLAWHAMEAALKDSGQAVTTE
ncbi:MAG: SUF system NifU family Fe-S cluster assembly protein [Fimbriimonadaceae bacterium]|nr:SUF system NifU family Fe-S cluster assembly protein [Fimbriimonadaceae bacterium]